MRLLTVLIGLAILTGCQIPMDGLSAVIPFTNIGDEAETITNVNNAPSLGWLLLMILGWMAPSPQAMFVGIGDWILRLFGRTA